MAINKANKAILKAKYGETVYEAMVKAENVLVTDGGEEFALSEKLALFQQQLKAAEGKLERKIVESVEAIDPGAADADHYLYMVKRADSASGNQYDEYLVIGGAVERVGDWDIDLSGYVQTEEGKGLSTNDYTDEEKAKLEAVTSAVSAKAEQATVEALTETVSAKADSSTVTALAETVATKSRVYASATQPEGMQSGDLWLQIFEEEAE